MAGYADQNGYMLPYKEFVRLQEEAAKAGLARSSVKGYNNVYAVGPMTQELFDETYESAWAVKANYFMPVPDWLIELEPTSSILLPNSDVIVREPLEADSDDGDQDTGCCGGNSEYGFYRYSADGELLGFTRGSWFTLYIDVEADGWSGCNVEGFRKDGYLLATDENGSLLVYNYDGEKLDVANEPPQRDMHGFTALKLTQLQLVHKYQNN